MRVKIIPDKSIIEALEKSGGIVTQAAILLGVCRQTLARRIKGNKKLKDAQLKAMEVIVDTALVSLMDKLKNPKYKSDTLIIYVLKTLGNRLYDGLFQEKQLIENVGEKPQNVILIKPPTTKKSKEPKK